MTESSIKRESRSRLLLLNERVAGLIGNGFDWIFRRDRLVTSGRTPFELVYDSDLMKVRYYDLADETHINLADGSRMPINRNKYPVPLVLVPPLGVTTETFDLMPQRSLVRYMAACGFRTYLIDWGTPGREHAHLGMVDYADQMYATALEHIRAHSGSREVSLMGWCMGGLLSLIFQGLNHDPDIRNIVMVASPINLRGGGIVAGAAQALNAPAHLIRKYTDFRLEKLDPARLHLPGWMTTLAFKMTDPVGSVATYWDLVTRLWDREFVVAHSTTANYLNNMLLYPGGVVQDLTIKMAVDNDLASGRIVIGDRVAELSEIDCPILVFAGETDILVKPPIAQKIMEIVASQDKTFRIRPGGHMGVILGSKAPDGVWADSVEWLSERSGPRQTAPRKQR
ncbi:MAG: alpha/beta hydrolase [Salinisphaeraceae bacterium]|jgi:polyhydroxyalkanoate synthase|nr:alpha/beta hydrolase [Salinisphaeraceae bacterium]